MFKINTLIKTKELLTKYDLKAKKKFGQNFLISDEILQNITELAKCRNNDLVIEIGPGLGNLTYYLLESNILAIDIDEDMIGILKDRFRKDKNVIILNEDILRIDIDKEIEILEDIRGEKFNNIKVVANLPYYITTPILFKLLESSNRIDEIIVILQKEVADRIVSPKGNKDYGKLTLMIKYFGMASKEIEVPRNNFIPAPNVESSVIKIVLNEDNRYVDYNLFKELVHKSFANRRKKVINSLSINKFLGKDKIDIEKIFEDLDISLNIRAEELALTDYIKIVEYIMR